MYYLGAHGSGPAQPSQTSRRLGRGGICELGWGVLLRPWFFCQAWEVCRGVEAAVHPRIGYRRFTPASGGQVRCIQIFLGQRISVFPAGRWRTWRGSPPDCRGGPLWPPIRIAPATALKKGRHLGLALRAAQTWVGQVRAQNSSAGAEWPAMPRCLAHPLLA
jgi:hypothetical protein